LVEQNAKIVQSGLSKIIGYTDFGDLPTVGRNALEHLSVISTAGRNPPGIKVSPSLGISPPSSSK